MAHKIGSAWLGSEPPNLFCVRQKFDAVRARCEAARGYAFADDAVKDSTAAVSLG